jgi:hypothetical protein
MNAPATTPNLSAMLSQVATVARVSTSSLGLRRLDKTASKESDRAHNALQGTAKVTASRFSGAEDRVKEINDIAAEVRAGLFSMTTAWGDYRLLANVNLQKWLEFYAPKKQAYDAKVARLRADAPALIAQAERNKGNFNVATVSEDEIDDAFSLEFDMQQIPDSKNFAASGVSKEVEAHMRRHFEAGIEAAYKNAQTDAMQRVAKPLGHLVEKLAAYDKAADEKARGITSEGSVRMHASTIGHVQDIAKVFRSFNLTNDPLLASVADKLDAFEGIEIEDIKTSGDLRKDLTKRADEILNDLRDLI